MKSNDASPPFETNEIGTPLDYTEDLYKFYLEVRDMDGKVERLLRDFLGTTQAEQLQRLPHGFELTLPIQCVPDIVRLLTRENVAIYQIVRYAKVAGSWR